MLPRSNARLTQIAGGGTIEDFSEAAGADTARWTGSVAAYVVERVLSEVSASGQDRARGARLDEAKRVYLTVPHGLPVELGDTVIYTHEGVSVERKVRDIERHQLVGLTRLHLWEA